MKHMDVKEVSGPVPFYLVSDVGIIERGTVDHFVEATGIVSFVPLVGAAVAFHTDDPAVTSDSWVIATVEAAGQLIDALRTSAERMGCAEQLTFFTDQAHAARVAHEAEGSDQ